MKKEKRKKQAYSQPLSASPPLSCLVGHLAIATHLTSRRRARTAAAARQDACGRRRCHHRVLQPAGAAAGSSL